MPGQTRVLVLGLAWMLACFSGCNSDSSSPDEGSPARDAAADDDARVENDAAPPDEPNPSNLPEICSGCEGAEVEVGDNEVHFHHVHLNTADLEESKAFYERVFGTVEVRLNELADVVKADGAFVLLESVDEQPSAVLQYGIEHIGWGALEVNAWYDMAIENDIRVDHRSGMFDGPLELVAGFWVIYLQGPSNERIEVNTEAHEEFGHLHFMTDDVDTTVAFYEALLGTDAVMPEATVADLGTEFDGLPLVWSSNTIFVDNVEMIFFGPPYEGLPEVYEPSEGGPIDHIAFGFADLDPILERIEDLGLEVVSEAAVDAQYGFRSVFVRAPNAVLVELVEAPAVPNPFP